MITDTATPLYIPGVGIVPPSSATDILHLSQHHHASLSEHQHHTSTTVRVDDSRLGYGVTPEDLGYGVDHHHHDDDQKKMNMPGLADLGYGEEPTTTRTTGAVGGGAAIQIRNGKRIRPLLGPYAGSSSSGRSDSIYSMDSYSTDDYSDDDDDDDSCVELHDDEKGGEEEDDMATPNPHHMPSQVNMEFKGNETSPRKISLAFSQRQEDRDGRCSTRTGCLEVSMRTSRLPRERRRATIDHYGNPTHKEEPGERIIRGNHSNLRVSATSRPMMKRMTMDHSDPTAARPTCTRRITMNLCSSRPRRNESLGGGRGSAAHMHGHHQQLPVKTLSNGKRSRGRRPTMEYSSSPAVPVTSRRISIDMSCPAATGGGSQRRKVSMNLAKSNLPRNTPPPNATTTTTTTPTRTTTRTTTTKPTRNCHARSA